MSGDHHHRRTGDESGDAGGAVRLAIFDLDDTLCDYSSARATRLRRAFGDALRTRPGADAVDDDGMERLIAESIAIHPHGTDHFAGLLRPYDVSDEAAATAASWYRANRFYGLGFFPDAIPTLEALRARVPRLPLGLVTNGPADVQRAKIVLLELEGLVDFALVSGEFGVEKPDPAIFREALRLGGSSPEETIFIGDSPEYDIAGARAAGLCAVWLNRTGREWPLPAPRPDFEVSTLTEVVDLIDSLNSAGDPANR